MLFDLLTASLRLVASVFDFLDFLTARGNTAAQAAAVLTVAVGVVLALRGMVRFKTRRRVRQPRSDARRPPP